MNSRRIWTATALLVVGHSAFSQDLPAPVLSISAAPATALTPMPMSEYLQQQPLPAASAPAPVAPIVVPEIEQTGFAGARFAAKNANLATPVPSAATPTFRPMVGTVGTMTAPQWRWYGWGAATTPGFGNAVQAPPPTNGTQPQSPEAPKSMPPAPGSETPKKDIPVIPVADPIRDTTWIPAPIPAPIAAPIAPAVESAAPAIDLTPLPKPVVPPPPTGPAVDPWTGISPSGAKATGVWKTVRASSAK